MEGRAFTRAPQERVPRQRRQEAVVVVEDEYSYAAMAAMVDDNRSGWSFADTREFNSVEEATAFVNKRMDRMLYDRYSAIRNTANNKFYVARHAGGKLQSSRQYAE